MISWFQITGKAVMLDEIINYVQSLQQQVEVRFSNHNSINHLSLHNFASDERLIMIWFLTPS